ncbi:MAG TPA: Asp23/Gls24 family envelope stress response protein [Acidimicrobiales bacterium]
MTDFSPDNNTAARPSTAGPGPMPFAPVSPSPTPSPLTRAEESSAGLPERPPVSVAPNGGLSPLEVKGRINVADEVVEKVAALAATEVEGVADLGGDFERAIESVRERIGIGHKRGDQGIKAKINGREVSVDVTIMIEYGHVVMDVARQVKNNVASQTQRMLGLTVVEVNVTVDDVRMPYETKPEDEDAGVISIEG